MHSSLDFKGAKSDACAAATLQAVTVADIYTIFPRVVSAFALGAHSMYFGRRSFQPIISEVGMNPDSRKDDELRVSG